MSITDSELRELQDKDLAIAFKRGDSGAYEAIYQRHRPRVEAVCRRMLQNQADAQEASQEAFLRVYKGLSKFNGRYQLSAWITRVTTNVCLDQLRAKSRRPSDPHPVEDLDFMVEPEPDGGDPAAVSIRSAEGRRIRKVLESLPPMHRAAIVLRDFEGLSYDEIADVLGISSTQTKALIHRARQNFKRTWVEALASLIFPWRLISRVRATDVTGREHAGQAMSASSSFAVQCNAAVQACGQYVFDKVGGVVTAAVVGTAAVTGAAVVAVPSIADGGNTASVPANAVSTMAQDDGSQTVKVKSRKAVSVSPTEDASGDPAPPVPSPQPPQTTEQPPAGAASPTPPPDQSDGGIGGDQPTGPTPTPSPTVFPEPQGFSLAAVVSGPAPVQMCGGCPWPTQLESESGRTDDSGLAAFAQEFRGSAWVDGSTAYGLDLKHSLNSGSHEMRFFLWTSEGSYGYEAAGSLTSRGSTDWGGWTYTFTGTFKKTSGPSSKEGVPQSGSYTTTITFSPAQNRIVSANISLV